MGLRKRRPTFPSLPEALVLLGLVGLVWAMFLPSEPPLSTVQWVGISVLIALGILGGVTGMLVRKRA